MGFTSSANTLTLTARLTPLGRKQLVSTNTSLITSFSLGDSDANYYASVPLNSGQVPIESGDFGISGLLNNSTTGNLTLKSTLIVNSNGVLKKPVESQSTFISNELVFNGETTISATNITQLFVDRANQSTDSLVNLFYSFGLPINNSDDNKFKVTTYANGGYGDTSISGIAQTKIAILAIDNSKFGETLDGKNIKISLPTTGGTYSIYSTYQKSATSLINQDANIRDTSLVTNAFGDNIAFLFSDDVMSPNGVSGLSWSTGYNINKPYSNANKQLFNLQNNPSLGQNADVIVGIAYLDKGIIVLTEPNLISNYANTPSTGLTISINSVSTDVAQNISCIAGRGEFGGSTNPSFGPTDSPRISEIVLYDVAGNVIAIAKTDKHIVKNINEFLAFGIKLSL